MINEDVFDPIAEINNSINETNQKIHVRIKQRNGRKCITLIEGLKNVKLQLVMQDMKNKFHCNGGITSENCIMLFGDQRMNSKKYLIEKSLSQETDIVIHGY